MEKNHFVMNRRNFLLTAASPFISTLIPKRNAKPITIVLKSVEYGDEYVGYGKDVNEAMGDLRREIESLTCEFDEWMLGEWEDAKKAFASGKWNYSGFDFSTPEQAFTLEII